MSRNVLRVCLYDKNNFQSSQSVTRLVIATFKDLPEKDIPVDCKYRQDILEAKEFYALSKDSYKYLRDINLEWYTDTEDSELLVTKHGEVWNAVTQTKVQWQERKKDHYFMVFVPAKREYHPRGRHPVFVHRLVALAFIPNPDNLPYINHKDRDPSNNDISNLEWCTQLQNIHWSMKLGVQMGRKKKR